MKINIIVLSFFFTASIFTGFSVKSSDCCIVPIGSSEDLSENELKTSRNPNPEEADYRITFKTTNFNEKCDKCERCCKPVIICACIGFLMAFPAMVHDPKSNCPKTKLICKEIPSNNQKCISEQTTIQNGYIALCTSLCACIGYCLFSESEPELNNYYFSRVQPIDPKIE